MQPNQIMMAEYGMEGCELNYLPILPKASIYVPKVMGKPVMDSNTVSETFIHMFLFWSVWCFEILSSQSTLSVMAEYGRKGCIESSSHWAQSLRICPKGNRASSKTQSSEGRWILCLTAWLLWTEYATGDEKMTTETGQPFRFTSQ